jgi:hypothetical protein
MAEQIETVGEDFPRQQARVRRLLEAYREIGPAGQFGMAMIEADLREADEAQASGDIVRILRAYQALKECK